MGRGRLGLPGESKELVLFWTALCYYPVDESTDSRKSNPFFITSGDYSLDV